VLPETELYFPAMHREHIVDSEDVPNVPKSHNLHEALFPTIVLYEPA
jgi:hypothetical protein